jgi:hypothetical protein
MLDLKSELYIYENRSRFALEVTRTSSPDRHSLQLGFLHQYSSAGTAWMDAYMLVSFACRPHHSFWNLTFAMFSSGSTCPLSKGFWAGNIAAAVQMPGDDDTNGIVWANRIPTFQQDSVVWTDFMRPSLAVPFLQANGFDAAIN